MASQQCVPLLIFHRQGIRINSADVTHSSPSCPADFLELIHASTQRSGIGKNDERLVFRFGLEAIFAENLIPPHVGYRPEAQILPVYPGQPLYIGVIDSVAALNIHAH
jgi:hypothetical protein